MATTFFYIGIAAAVAATAVLGFGASQLNQQRNALSRGQYLWSRGLGREGAANSQNNLFMKYRVGFHLET